MNIRELDALADRILKLMGVKNKTLDVFLVSNKEIRALNYKFLGKDKATNVLAFPDPTTFPKAGKIERLGEIYLSPEYIEDHNENIVFMLVHGVLHLLGFDHAKLSDRIEMEKLEKRIYHRITNEYIRKYE